MSNVGVLQEAIERGCLESVLLALDCGADVEEPDVHGCPGLPLRLACFYGHVEIVQELLRRGARLDSSNAQGPGAPLRMAKRGGHDRIVALLMAHGAESPPDVPARVKPLAAERRKGRERRVVDYGPPQGMRDRRHREDRRATSIGELELSHIEWAAFFKTTDIGLQGMPRWGGAPEGAALVLERARD